ncbi:MAG: DUF4442 domain-containing protein [Myxococcales bacterium]|nr:DUF4442 domain-containing protein [Myxococcales bacterium]
MTSAPGNRLSRIVQPLAGLPPSLRTPALTLLLGRTVRFVGTAGLSVERLTASECVVSVKNRPRVQNHIGGVHAAAMALLAETATGLVVGVNVPDRALPLIKTMKVDYLRRSEGGLRAHARLDEDARARIVTEPRGELHVPVTLVDDAGAEPVACDLVWAWVPKKR